MPIIYDVIDWLLSLSIFMRFKKKKVAFFFVNVKCSESNQVCQTIQINKCI